MVLTGLCLRWLSGYVSVDEIHMIMKDIITYMFCTFAHVEMHTYSFFLLLLLLEHLLASVTMQITIA